MIEIKEAVNIAMTQLSEFYKEKNVKNVLLEEVEFSKMEYWLITIGFDILKSAFLSKNLLMITSVLGSDNTKSIRKFKVFKIKKKDGEIISMKIRDVK